jgi:hypothetical protein
MYTQIPYVTSGAFNNNSRIDIPAPEPGMDVIADINIDSSFLSYIIYVSYSDE